MIIQLNNRALIKLSGADAQTFLQGQFSNDIDAITEKTAQINAYCQHQGKIIALFWVLKQADDFYLSLPQNLTEVVLKRLQMFVMMSALTISDVSADFTQFGIIDEDFADSFRLNSRQSIIFLTKKPKQLADEVLWEETCITMNLAEVDFINSEKLVPQMLNLDIDEVGVNFSKGCYPGQEVVARLHYLGKAKRRMYQFKSDADVQVGDALIVADSKSSKASGLVVRRARLGQKSICLATLEVAHKDDKVTLNTADGAHLLRIKNE